MKMVLNDAVKAAFRRRRDVSSGVGGAEEALERLADPGAGPHELAEAAETRRRVWRAMEELPPAIDRPLTSREAEDIYSLVGMYTGDEGVACCEGVGRPERRTRGGWNEP